jgi:hypothetical protein
MMRRTMMVILVALGGCAMNTSFKGDAHFPGGVQGCQSSCQSQGLEMSGFVMSGEFASSCVCRPPGASAASDDGAERVAADVAGHVGVEVQRRNEEEENDAARRRRQQQQQTSN